MDLLQANGMPYQYKDVALLHNGPSLGNASHTDWNFWCRRWIFWIPPLGLSMLETLDLIQPYRKGRVVQGAFFFLCSLVDNYVDMWNETSYMTSLSTENFAKTCRAFFTLYICMNVPRGDSYQSSMSIIAAIVACDMQYGSCSNIILYTKVTKWCDNCMITPWTLHSENNLQ